MAVNTETQTTKEKKCCCTGSYQIAELNEDCCRKIQEFEQDLNRHGCWNVSLVAYQKME